MSKWREIFNQSKHTNGKRKQRGLCCICTILAGQSGSERLRSCYLSDKRNKSRLEVWEVFICWTNLCGKIYFQYIIRNTMMLISTYLSSANSNAANTFKTKFNHDLLTCWNFHLFYGIFRKVLRY